MGQTKETNHLERFITENGIKKCWLSDALGLSPELFRHYMKKGRLPEDLEKQALDHLARLSWDIETFIVTYPNNNK